MVGDFNVWDGRRHPMRLRRECGVWELFMPGVAAGDALQVRAARRATAALLPLKADPFACRAELRPGHRQRRGRRCRRVGAAWPDAPRAPTRCDAPMSIYEVHLGSWRRKPEDGDRWLTWDELADAAGALRPGHGLHPPRAAAGQRAPVRRLLGLPAAGPVRAHRALRHAARTSAASSTAATQPASACCWTGCRRTSRPTPTAWREFDGTHLYEHADPREGFHHDWNTLIYNFGRTEVRNFLVGNALYWLERYDIDGLRVDAVASMLYRDYSRKAGEWIPNRTAGARTWRRSRSCGGINEVVGGERPEAITMAEESTALPAVIRPT